MSPLFSTRSLALLCVLLSACATSSSVVPETLETTDVVYSWEEARADPSCVVPLCNEERCALWRCQDVAEVDTTPSVVLVRGSMPQAVRPHQVGNLSRWWGHPLAAPSGTEPVFEIPWHNWKAREQLAFKEYRSYCIARPWEPFEKHHIFPQQEVLARWFESNHIDIHAYTVRVLKSFHTWLHSGGPDGGQWNEAWRQLMLKNAKTATAEDIWRFAGELMIRFGVNGPLIPYNCD
ncbi:TIGR02269 family lipoprotein [Vitiosangium sp. GDMCC 1.1324]|uniref:SitA6 family polymorphic toxin lipoprotein n=1 Tax=Vitiosangium sp. (strain GDMCC 1.1324) TaxID=2138576 RepID=UPI000D362236|nr:TIGR02269 family lipoprotein [Vitiosangium sp. GDMCC 1.1324]PTL76694.1 hypothetical protein DAT35_48050 [Vitiosangium sp. GDMCC 1.1324]